MRKFQSFVRSKPADELDGEDAKAFLTDLAVRQGVAASTQNRAFNALSFFYSHVLRREFRKLDGVVRAKRRFYVPVVLSRSEVEAVLSHLEPPYHLVALLLYGCGLRLSECLELRVHCFNLKAMLLTVHDGKGQKDRTIPLPRRALPEIREQLDAVRRLHQEDLASAYTGVFLPRQLRFLPLRGLTKLYAMEDGGAAGDEDHGINDRFFLSARALPSHCSCAVFQRYSVSCQTPSGKGP